MLLAVASHPAWAGGKAMLAEPVEGEKVRIDGDLREWPSRMTPLDETLRGNEIQARVVLGYDENNVYLALRVSDTRIARTSAGGAAEDHATLALAFPRGRDYVTHELQIYPGKPGKLPASVRLEGKAVRGAKAVEQLDGKELLIEAQVPWTAFPEASKTRVGLRAAVSYTNSDSPGSVKGVVSTSKGQRGRGLAALFLEGEQGLAALLRERNLPDHPAREVYGNVSGDALFERVAVFGTYLTITGPRFRGGKEFYFAELGGPGAELLQRIQLVDFDADGRDEVVLRKRLGTQDKYREVLEVVKVGRDDAPFIAFTHEVAIKTPDGSVVNQVQFDPSGIQISQGESSGFEAETYAEPLAGNMPSALLPWQSTRSQRFTWKGNAFVGGAEADASSGDASPSEPRASSAKRAGADTAGAPRSSERREPPAPRAPSSEERLDRVYALYRKERGVGSSKPRFDFVTDVAGDEGPERVLIHDKDIIAFGKGFRKGTSYAFISVGVADAKDILDVTARDMTGDGKAEIVVRALMRTKASKALGGDTVDRHALLVYAVQEERLVRIFGAETGRALGKNRILGAVTFEPASRGLRIELRPARAIGWTEESYPFPADTTAAGGLEPLLLPWSAEKRGYRYDGELFVAE